LRIFLAEYRGIPRHLHGSAALPRDGPTGRRAEVLLCSERASCDEGSARCSDI